MIIAYGPVEARLPAVCLLFHYWPENFPNSFYGNQILKPVHYEWERKFDNFYKNYVFCEKDCLKY